MGLDISYYKNLKKIDCVFDADEEPIDPATHKPLEYDQYFQAHVNSDFPERSNGIEDRAVYCFGDSGGFRAGSYGGYNNWREELAALAGYPAIDEELYGQIRKRHDAGAQAAGEGPFYELIWFSDCEGVIGPTVSAKLAKDFACFQGKADAKDEYFREKYNEWRKAFEWASENGAVDFH